MNLPDIKSLLAAISVALATLAIAAPASPQYSATSQHFPSGSTYTGPATANRLGAASSAQGLCEATHAQGYCEIVAIDGKPITTSADLKATLPARHPLYLWRYQKGAATVYLAGSIHLLKPGFYPLPRQFEAAYQKADYLVVEVDTEAISPQALQQKSMQYGRLQPGQSLSQILPAQTYQGLARVLQEYGAPIVHFETLKPNLVTQQLAVFALLSVGYDPSAGLEAHFRNKQPPKPVLQLESFDFQLDLLLNAPMPTQIEMAASTLQQMPEFESLTSDLMAAWLAGDDAAFEKATAATQGDSPALQAFNERLIAHRNHSMSDTITGYLQTDKTYFVLVGAAHLLGEQGIPALLNQSGYKGTRFTSHAPNP